MLSGMVYITTNNIRSIVESAAESLLRQGRISSSARTAIQNVNGHSSAIVRDYYLKEDRTADVYQARSVFETAHNHSKTNTPHTFSPPQTSTRGYNTNNSNNIHHISSHLTTHRTPPPPPPTPSPNKNMPQEQSSLIESQALEFDVLLNDDDPMFDSQEGFFMTGDADHSQNISVSQTSTVSPQHYQLPHQEAYNQSSYHSYTTNNNDNTHTQFEHRQASVPILPTSHNSQQFKQHCQQQRPTNLFSTPSHWNTHDDLRHKDWGSQHPMYLTSGDRIKWSDEEISYLNQWWAANGREKEKRASRCLIEILKDKKAVPIFHQKHILNSNKLTNGFDNLDKRLESLNEINDSQY